MAHFGSVVPSLPGHLRPTLALARALVTWGHRVTIFSTQDAERLVREHGVGFCAVGTPELSCALDNPEMTSGGTIQRLSGLKDRVDRLCARIQVLYAELPELLMNREIEALLVDQVEAGALDVAEDLQLPRVVLSTGLLMRPVVELPPSHLDWPVRTDRLGRWRNRLGNVLTGYAFRRWCQAREDQRDDWALPPPPRQFGLEPGVSYVLQQPEWFDGDDTRYPEGVYPTGPWMLANGGPTTEFPWHRLDGRPLAYVNLGNRVEIAEAVYRQICDTCHASGYQLVITCSSPDVKERLALPGRPIVVPFAPQTALLERAKVFVTHAGLTSVLESLQAGVPMIAIPMVDTQPGVATRLRSLGVAEIIEPASVTPAAVRAALARVMLPEGATERARACSRRLAMGSDGVCAAAGWVEKLCLPKIRDTYSGNGLPLVSGANQINTAPTR